MRPPEFTGGNVTLDGPRPQADLRFNEAAGIHRRKPARWLRSRRGRILLQ